ERLTNSRLEVGPSASNAPANLARRDQPFAVRLKLDPAFLAASGAEPLVYNAVFYARAIGDQGARASSRVSGKIEQTENPSITIKGLYLQPGSYALNASVIFNQPGKSSSNSVLLHIQTESSLLHIY